MKETVTYKKKCAVCGNIETYILRGKNVNPMSDEGVEFVLSKYRIVEPRFEYCEKCKLITKQEIVAFDY